PGGATSPCARAVPTPPTASTPTAASAAHRSLRSCTIIATSTKKGSFDHERRVHPRLEMLGYVTMGHPRPGIRRLEQDVDRRAHRHEHGVLPGQVRVRHAVAREHQEALAVEMDGMAHRVHRLRIVEQPDLDDVATLEPPR